MDQKVQLDTLRFCVLVTGQENASVRISGLMLETPLHTNTPTPIPSGALASLPEDFQPTGANPEPESLPLAKTEALEQLFAEAVAFVNQVRKALPQLPGEDALHSGERSILRILEEAGPRTVPQLARARSTSRQNVQVIINRLFAAERVEFCDNPSHKRSKFVALTVRGKQWLAAFNQGASFKLPAKVEIRPGEMQSASHVLSRLRQTLAEDAKSETQGKTPDEAASEPSTQNPPQ